MNDFDFCQPRTVDEALDALSAGDGRVMPIAGGTNLMVNLKRAPLEADRVVDLSRIDGLARIEERDGVLAIGAGVTFAQLLDWRPGGAVAGLLGPMSAQFAGPLTRNLATIGGNLCDASPAADLSPPLLALEAGVTLASARRGSRSLPLEDFFLGPRRTIRRADELLTRVEIPRPEGNERYFYYKLGKRRADAISIVSVALSVRLRDGLVERARLALGAVGPVAMRVREAEDFLSGRPLDESAIGAAARRAAAESRPIDDFRASASYRRDMVEVLVRRGLRRIATPT